MKKCFQVVFTIDEALNILQRPVSISPMLFPRLVEATRNSAVYETVSAEVERLVTLDYAKAKLAMHTDDHMLATVGLSDASIRSAQIGLQCQHLETIFSRIEFQDYKLVWCAGGPPTMFSDSELVGILEKVNEDCLYDKDGSLARGIV